MNEPRKSVWMCSECWDEHRPSPVFPSDVKGGYHLAGARPAKRSLIGPIHTCAICAKKTDHIILERPKANV